MKEEDGSYSFSLGEVAEENTQLWEMNEESYDYANQYFTYLEEQNPELVSMKEQIKIEELQDKKLKLCYNYNTNKEEIEMIDNELETLGVVELTADEVEAKMGEENEVTSPNARVAIYPAMDGVVWTSSRTCVVYRGKVIELQILVANPGCGEDSSESELITRTVVATHHANVELAAQGVIKAVAEELVIGGIEKIPVVGGAIATGVTALSWAEIFASGLSTSTVIEDVDVSYTIDQFGETKKVYAKYESLSDDYQILAYIGNKSNITIDVSEPPVYVGNPYPDPERATYQGWVASPEYESNFKTYAAQLYYNYKNGISEMEENHLLYAFTLIDLDENAHRISMPVYYY